ncbi:MAG: hypothetical protein K0Q77_853 [Anaerosporomusa subterranea]|jgi:hypothetical protein|nr:hypothetical protein [Anaerosporomusa subterranea]
MIMNKTTLGSIGIAIISIVYLWEANRLPVGSTAAPDIGYVPWLIGWISLGLCVLLVLNVWLAERSTEAANTQTVDEGVGPGPWIIAAGILVYPAFLDNLGFIVGTTPLIYVSLLVMGYRRRWAALGIAILMTGIAYYLFSQWLGVQFPTGLFGW